MVPEAARVDLGLDVLADSGGLSLGRRVAAGKSGIGKRKLARDLGVFAIVAAEGRGPSFGCSPAKIVAVMRHARAPPIFDDAKTFIAGTVV